MYIDYTKLWKLLLERGISKTDLMELTGISSRVLAKLSKNQTVTTDTIARICGVLGCDVGDVMECVSEEKLTVYGAFRKLGVCTEEADAYKAYRFTHGEKNYAVYVTKEAANKATHIVCDSDGTVYREQFHSTGFDVYPVRSVVLKPIRAKEVTEIIVIKGKPCVIAGLDENGYVSAKGKAQRDTDVYVMSEAAFKLFEGR